PDGLTVGDQRGHQGAELYGGAMAFELGNHEPSREDAGPREGAALGQNAVLDGVHRRARLAARRARSSGEQGVLAISRELTVGNSGAPGRGQRRKDGVASTWRLFTHTFHCAQIVKKTR